MTILLDQILAYTKANLKSRYRNTVTGFIWVVMNPILMMGAQSYAFHYVLKLNIPHYALFLLSGLLPWSFIMQSLEMTSTILLNSSGLLKAFPIHPAVPLLAQILDNFINFSAAFMILFIPMFWGSDVPWAYLLLLPFPILTMIVAVACLSALFSILQVFFRDTRFILTFILSISFFLTPIFYAAEMVPENLRFIVDFNIFYKIILPFRMILRAQELADILEAWIQIFVIDICLVVLTVWIWKRKRNAVYNLL